MAVKNILSYRGAAALAATLLAFTAIAVYFGFEAHTAITTGVVKPGSRSIELAASPKAYWLRVSQLAYIAVGAAILAAGTLYLMVQMHRKGLLFVAERPPVARNTAPLIDESKRSKIDS